MRIMEPETQAASQSPGQDCILVYDGTCRFCVSIKKKLEQIGAGQAEFNVRFLDYRSAAAARALGHDHRPGRPGRPDMAFLIRPSGEVLRGLEAFLPIILNLPGGKLLLWCLRFPSVKQLGEWGYRMVARHRYRWFGEADLHSQED
jgi:predicted DCC family thiol-disulfide oxidoreductase YuxK